MSNVPNKVIYSMIGVSKYYDKKPVLKDIYLSYFYGATPIWYRPSKRQDRGDYIHQHHRLKTEPKIK